MKFILFLFLLISNLVFGQQQEMKLWYKEPANAIVKDQVNGQEDDPEWLKALPMGNGHLGAMIFGDVNMERVQLNEKTLWSGSHDDNDNPEAAKYLDQIRSLLFAGKYKEATALTNQTQVSKGAGSGLGRGAKLPFGSYQTVGDLFFDFENKSGYKDYYRELDLNEAVTHIRYTQGDIRFYREMFVSYPAKALVIRFTANKKGAISF